MTNPGVWTGLQAFGGAAQALSLAIYMVLMPPAQAQSLGGAPAAPPPAAEPELPASDLLVRYESPALSFRWSLAPEAALEPALVRALRSDALATREKSRRDADADAKQMPRPGGRPLGYQWIERWTAEAETDLLLSLSSKLTSFTGGAHGNLSFGSALWDRSAERRIVFADLFSDPGAALAALRQPFCKALDEERLRRRAGAKLEGYTDCPDLAPYPIVPVGMGSVMALRVLVPPYEAGPWVEGPYEIMLSADLVKPYLLPRYAADFANP